MPLPPGEDVGTAIRELHTGKTYRRTKKKLGKKKADKQSVAIAISNSRRKKHRKGSRGMRR
jgi:hypothetical protein